MIQALMALFKMFCGFGGQYLMPFLFPIFSLVVPPQLVLGWIVLLICFFLPIMVSGENGINKLNSSDGQTRNGGRAFGFAALFYYICMVIVTCSVYQVACKVADSPIGDILMPL